MAMTQRIEGSRIGILGAAALMLAMLAIATPAAANPVQPGIIVLISTSGTYSGPGASTSLSGPAAGTMTLTPVPTPASVYGAKLTAGSISLGTTTYSITGGSAAVTPWLISGMGTIQGGSFTFTAFSVTATAHGNPYSYNLVVMQVHVGGSYYLVLLHVRTIMGAAAQA